MSKNEMLASNAEPTQGTTVTTKEEIFSQERKMISREEEVDDLPERHGRLSEFSLGIVNGYMMFKDLEIRIIECLEDKEYGILLDAGFAEVTYEFTVDNGVIFTDMFIKVFNDEGKDYQLVKCYQHTMDDDFYMYYPQFLAGEFFKACLALEYQDEIE